MKAINKNQNPEFHVVIGNDSPGNKKNITLPVIVINNTVKPLDTKANLKEETRPIQKNEIQQEKGYLRYQQYDFF
jgi:hypothetical protein